MKKLIIALACIALGLVVFNLFYVDFAAPLQGDSMVALVGIVAGLCAIVLLALMWVAKAIQDKVK